MNLNLSFGSLSGPKAYKLEDQLYDLLIIGGGPAGLNAALYTKRKGLAVGIISKNLGGQLMDTNEVDNYLGVLDLNGELLAKSFVDHIRRLEIPTLEEAVVGYRKEGNVHILSTFSGEYRSKAVLLATGSNPRKLGVPGEDAFSGKGVTYCAICDGPLYKGRDVIVAGGGNSAVEAAIDLAKTSSSVTIVHRSQLRADQILVDQLYALPHVKVMLQTQIQSITGDEKMKGIIAKDSLGQEIKLDGEAIFIEIGYNPNLSVFQGLLAVNGKGEVLISERHETSEEGIFAAGDLTQIEHKQIIVAAAEGAKAALNINQWLNAQSASL